MNISTSSTCFSTKLDTVVDLRLVVKSLNLTEWGALFLSAFPIEAVEWADKNFFRGNRKSEPFKRFTNLCVEHCNQSNVQPAWRPMYEQQRIQGMPANARMITSPTTGGPKRTFGGSLERALSSTVERAREGSQKREKQTDDTTTGSIKAVGGTPLSPHEKYIGATKVRILSEEETNARRAAFINNPECVAGIAKLAKIKALGEKFAQDYFIRVLDNLKYIELVEI